MLFVPETGQLKCFEQPLISKLFLISHELNASTLMSGNSLDTFLNVLRLLFKEESRDAMTVDTDLKSLKEWSSLQTMIIVNEIDKEYQVVLDVDDLKNASSVRELFETVQLKKR
jgi:acyl carrier protein